MTHLGLLLIYALLLGVFFALLWRRGLRAQVRLFLQIFLGMVGSAILLGWIMYFFPTGPAAPFP